MPTYTVVTFGCQMNQHDSERMSEVLEGSGYVEASGPDDADVVVLNTCSVREKAEQKLRSEVGRLALTKPDRAGRVLVVAGCVAQQEGERIRKTMPAVDLVVGPDNIAELPGLLDDLAGGGAHVRTVFDVESPEFLQARPRPGRVGPTAFVTVMKGCNERCSFCIVPTTRGPERYRRSSEVVDEVRRLSEAGVREVTLLGQTVNSYRDPDGALPQPEPTPDFPFASRKPGDETEFPALLRAIVAGAPALRRLRYTSPHPRHLTPALARAHADLDVLARHVHMPVQSGSPRVLKRMIRRYTVEEYVERLGLVSAAIPGVTFSTDIIVGFPGETDEDFAATLDLVKRVGFVGIFGFKYSVRPHTPALRLGDDVPEATKAARLAALFELSEALRRAHLEGLVGTRAEVLVEGPARGGGYTGRTERNEIVHVGAADDPTGEIVSVVVRRAFKNSLEAELVDTARARPRQGRPASTERRALPVI